MKKYLIILLIFILTACGNKEVRNVNEQYTNLIKTIDENKYFSDSSKYFDIDAEIARIDSGYRYYVTIDNPVFAMYDIELVAIEKGMDLNSQMAATVGIFEETEYKMIPNQYNVEEGYVKGIVASAISDSPSCTLDIFVQFKNADYSKTYSEFIELDVSYID